MSSCFLFPTVAMRLPEAHLQTFCFVLLHKIARRISEIDNFLWAPSRHRGLTLLCPMKPSEARSCFPTSNYAMQLRF